MSNAQRESNNNRNEAVILFQPAPPAPDAPSQQQSTLTQDKAISAKTQNKLEISVMYVRFFPTVRTRELRISIVYVVNLNFLLRLA